MMGKENFVEATPSDFDYDFLAKVTLVGPPGVGKTQIRYLFAKGSFSAKYDMTIGAEFAAQSVEVDLPGLGKKP